ncbi:UrcA family protein [Aurantiacibacter zhengii]|uniref:UrcA family protein n=1 Tax=Aurantiacibacter zhengii TaxID=2307003 RepID=A0A418NSR4_9SPHN|nr:UrcA family protein [Aurantiacibacter zhengii]RIV86532.1 UrcA family protein [Aurantiacibacter zhengii]
MKTRSTNSLIGSALAAAAMTLAATGVSAQDEQTRAASVSHADLDLSTAEGVRELDRRIDSAAREVCGFGEVELGSRIPSRETRQCYRTAKRQLDRQFAQIVEDAQRVS